MSFLKKLFGSQVKETEVFEIEKEYQKFWEWFTQNEKRFKEVIETQDNVVDNFIEVVSPKLKAINPNFNMLAGGRPGSVTEFIVTPDGALKAVPFVEDFIVCAPDIEGWSFLACKKPSKGIALRMGDFELSEDTVSFIPLIEEGYPDYIALRFIIDAYTPENEEELGNALFIFLDNYIGEMLTMTEIDHLEVRGNDAIEGEPIPVSKLEDYLNFRSKEFVEKYDGVKRNSDLDDYVLMEMKNDDEVYLATLNKSFIFWEKRMSYPWVIRIDMFYEAGGSGMPNKEDVAIMDEIEDLLNESGIVTTVVRETGGGERNLYLATQDFRTASKEVFSTLSLYDKRIKSSYRLYKDKYWFGMQGYADALSK
ncbi:MAG: DUF695 domain-containing protein [Flavobacteriaceae bacterium]|jgi:hypothetical protein|nr:DUF695 domain-containing protein [Flavobacteriaceae bacterium]